MIENREIVKNIYFIMKDLRLKYEKLKKEAFSLYKKGKLEESLNYIVTASTFAWWYHFGYWSDGELEELIKKIGSNLLERELSIYGNITPNENNVLFLTTYLTNSGGHTEAIKLWISCLSGSFENIYIISTEVYNKTSLNFFEYDIYEKTQYIKLTGRKYIDRIKDLARIIVQVKPAYVFLFIDPNDVVSLVALSYLKPKLDSKIIFFNHSDHTFWLGKDIIDILVEFRSYSIIVSRLLRKFQGNITVVPLSTKIHATNNNDSKIANEALKSLNLTNNYKTISLSIGASWKFVSDGEWDYFKAIENILKNTDNHVHILITMKDKYIENRLCEFPEKLKNRFKVLYNISNPLPYYKVADFIIESFPVIGGTVRLEAMALCKPIIFIKNKRSAIFSVTDVIPKNYSYVACSEEKVIEYATLFIKSEEERKKAGKLLKEYFDENFTPEKICEEIRNVLKDKNIQSNSEYKNLEILDSNEYLLSYDIRYRGLINPYLILLKIYLNKKNRSILDYLRASKNLSIKDISFGLKKFFSKIW